MKVLPLTTLLAALLLAGCDKLKLGQLGATAETEEPAVRELGASEFDDFIATPDRLLVVDFHAEWCGPCKQLGPVLEEVVAEFDDKVVLGKVDVDQAGELARRLGVRSIPDVRLFRNGVMVDQFVGSIPKAKVRERIQRHTFGLNASRSGEEPAKEGEPQPTILPMGRDWLPPGIERK